MSRKSRLIKWNDDQLSLPNFLITYLLRNLPEFAFFNGSLDISKAVALPGMHWIVSKQVIKIDIDLLIITMPSFRDELELEVMSHIINAVPSGIVWPNHCGTHSSATTFIMP